MKSEETKIYDFIVNNNIATENEIQLVTTISGWNTETLNDIIYARTGYHDPEQCVLSESENYFDACDDFSTDPDEEEETDD
jgi:hypothetical protein